MATVSAATLASLNSQLNKIKAGVASGVLNQSGLNQAAAGIKSASSSVATISKNSGSNSSRTTTPVKDTTPTTNNAITAASMAPAPTPKLPTLPVPTGTPNIGALNSALTNVDTGLKQDSTGGFTVAPIAQAQMDSNQTRLDKYMADLTSANTNKTSAIDIQKQLDKQTGIDALKRQEADYTGQINSIVKNSEAAKLALEGQGRGQTTGFLGGEQARIGREAAIQALPVQAQLAAVQGKIQVATDYINKWGALLVQDANDKYNFKVNTIKAVYDFGTAQDKIKFDDLASQAKAKKDAEVALATAKTKAISQALAQPGGNAVVQAIQNATDENGVVAALGKFNGDVLGNQLKQANLYTESLQQKKLLAELNPAPVDSSSDSNLVAYGNQFAETGTLPTPSELKLAGITAGQITAYAKQVPKPSGALVSNTTGTKQKNLSSAQEDGISALYDLTKKLDLAKERFSKLNTGLLPGLAKTVYYTQEQQQYDDLKSEIVDLLARARSGAALTADEVANYNQKLPGRFNDSLFLGKNGVTSIQDLNDSITNKLKTNLNTNNLSIYGFSTVKVPQLGEHKVGDLITVGDTQYRVLPDGTLTDILQ